MSIFTAAEVEYLTTQRLGRLATAGTDGRPHVVPVAFRFNPDLDSIDVGGHNFATRKKYRDVQANPWAAIVVDDLASTDPWRARMRENRGRVEGVGEGGATLGPGFDDAMMRIRPVRIAAFGLDPDQPHTVARTV